MDNDTLVADLSSTASLEMPFVVRPKWTTAVQHRACERATSSASADALICPAPASARVELRGVPLLDIGAWRAAWVCSSTSRVSRDCRRRRDVARADGGGSREGRRPAGTPQAHFACNCRIGIANGLIVVGELVGTGNVQKHGVLGETPSVAARLQAEASTGGIDVLEPTRRLAGDWLHIATAAPAF